MAFNLGELIFKMSADTAQLRTDMADTRRMVGEHSGQIAKSAEFAKAAIETLGIAFGVHEMVEWVRSSVDVADQANKTAQKIGVTTEALTGLQYAAKLADVDNEALQASLVKLAKNMSAAADGSKSQQKAFEDLGIEVTNSNGTLRSVDSVLSDVAEKFSHLEDGAKKAALAQEIFGRSGADLIPLLNAGADGIGKMQAEAKEFGLVISGETARAAEEFNDNLTRLKATGEGFKNSVVAEMLPALSRISEAMVEAAKDGGTLYAVWVGFGGVASNVLGLDVDKIRDANKSVKELTGSIQILEDDKAKAKEYGINTDYFDRQIAFQKMQLEYAKEYRQELESTAKVGGSASMFEAPDISGVVSAQAEIVKGYSAIIDASMKSAAAEQAAYDKKTEALLAWLDIESARAIIDEGKQISKANDSEQSAVKQISDEYAPETERITDKYLAEREIILEATTITEEERQRILSEMKDSYDEKLLGAERKASQKRDAETKRGLSSQARLWKSGLDGQLKVASSTLGDLSQLMNSHNRSTFEIGKAAALGKGTIDMISSAMSSFRAGSEIGGPYVGAAFAAVAVAAGLANLQSIQSTQFGGSGGGATAGGSAAPSIVPTYGNTAQDGSSLLGGSTTDTRAAQTIVINGDIHSNDAERLLGDIKALINNSDFVLIEPTSRQASELRA